MNIQKNKFSTTVYGVKGLCAIFIIIYHYSVYYTQYINPDRPSAINFAELTVAVPIFFIFSSFFLYDKALKSKKAIYIIRYRLTRLYPMYWISVIYSSLILILNGRNISAKEFILNLSMLEKLFGVDHLDGAYWTLFYELMLLFIIASGAIVSSHNTKLLYKPLSFCYIWLVFSGIGSAIIKLNGIDNSTNAVMMFASRYAAVFVSGIAFHSFFVSNNLSKNQFVLLLIASITHALIFSENLKHGIHAVISILICIFIFKGFLDGVPCFTQGILVDIGKKSYNIYLTHNIFGKYCIKLLSRYNIANPVINIFICIIIGILAVLIGFAFSPIEKKIISLFPSADLQR